MWRSPRTPATPAHTSSAPPPGRSSSWGETLAGPPRVLVATFGFDERKVFRAMRVFPYDRLSVIGGPDSFRSPGFRRLREVEGQAGGTVETTAVDPWDFAACFRGAVGVLARHPRPQFAVRVNVAGGTKVLADAATLAAFHEGVECWHVDGNVAVRLPILRGFRFVDALTPAERTVLARVTRPRRSQDLLRSVTREGLPATEAEGALASLIRRGLVAASLDRGRAVISPVPSVARPRSRGPGGSP